MVPRKDIITAPEGTPLEKTYQLLEQSKKGKIPIVDEQDRLTALIARTDIKKNREYPWSSTDAQGRLLVGAAIPTREESYERLRHLKNAGVDVIVIVSNGILIDCFFGFS